VYNNTQLHQDKMKKIFYKHTKVDDFKLDDLSVEMGCKK
jgi:hypothetical protein